MPAPPFFEFRAIENNMANDNFAPVFFLLPNLSHTNILRSALQIVNEGLADVILIYHQNISRDDVVAELRRMAGTEHSATDRHIYPQPVTVRQYEQVAELLLNAGETRSANLDDILAILMPLPGDGDTQPQKPLDKPDS